MNLPYIWNKIKSNDPTLSFDNGFSFQRNNGFISTPNFVQTLDFLAWR